MFLEYQQLIEIFERPPFTLFLNPIPHSVRGVRKLALFLGGGGGGGEGGGGEGRGKKRRIKKGN